MDAVEEGGQRHCRFAQKPAVESGRYANRLQTNKQYEVRTQLRRRPDQKFEAILLEYRFRGH
jgi:hypothetical protein